LAYLLTLNMKAVCSFEMLGYLWTTWCCNAEDYSCIW
jgi:hypothetical protein